MSLTRVPSNDPRLGPGAVPQLTRSINKMTTEKSKFSSPRVQISPLRVQISPLRAQISPLRVQISPLRVQICRASFKMLCNSPVSLRHGVVLLIIGSVIRIDCGALAIINWLVMPVLLCSFLVLKFLLKQLKKAYIIFVFSIFEAQTVCITVLIYGVDINHFIEKKWLQC